MKIKSFLSLVVVFVFEGCVSLFPKVKDLPQVYTFGPDIHFSSNLKHLSKQIVIEEPYAPAFLNSARMAVQLNPHVLDYYAGVRLEDRLPKVLQNLMIEAFEQTKKVKGILRESTKVSSDYLVSADVHHFHVVKENNQTQVHVKISVKLIHMKDRTLLGTKIFEEKVVSEGNVMHAIIKSYNQALNKLLEHVVLWTFEQAHSHG
jgi:cholesterol transport system auxiliary component